MSTSVEEQKLIAYSPQPLRVLTAEDLPVIVAWETLKRRNAERGAGYKKQLRRGGFSVLKLILDIVGAILVLAIAYGIFGQ